MVLVLSAGCRSASGDCPKFLAGQKVGTVQSALIKEASGLAASRKNPGVLWVHNDGGSPCVYAITPEGKLLGVYNLAGAKVRNWEDIAIGPGPEPNVDYLYVGDIGDNNAKRKDVTVYRIIEPNVNAGQAFVNFTINNVESILFFYTHGPPGAQNVLLEPRSKNHYII